MSKRHQDHPPFPIGDQFRKAMEHTHRPEPLDQRLTFLQKRIEELHDRVHTAMAEVIEGVEELWLEVDALKAVIHEDDLTGRDIFGLNSEHDKKP